MKSYFMDELQSLKQDALVKKNWDQKQDETTKLKNKTKLLELENQLLTCDVPNKQIFIDTILEHNSKLSHKIDVTPISLTKYDHYVTTSEPQHIKENKNCERNDTEHNDQRKYKSNWGNKKSDDNNKQKKKSKQNKLPTDTNNENVQILGDSIVKHEKGWKLKNSLQNKALQEQKTNV